jgi:hypothetical protein
MIEMSSSRFVFDPASTPGGQPLNLLRSRPGVLTRRVVAAYVAFYRDRLAWLALAVSAVLLCYVGGAIMFWFHAVRLGEGGPAISWQAHWLLDSTFGFFGLTPALFLLLPVAAGGARTLVGESSPRLVPWLYVAICGSLFAVITTPGPVAHDLLVGRGTWVAKQATRLIGDPTAQPTPAHHYPLLAKLTQQLGAGVAVYLILTGVSVLLVRVLVAIHSQTAAARRVLQVGEQAGGAATGGSRPPAGS